MIYTISERVDIVRDAREPSLWPGGLMLMGNARAHLWQVAIYAAGVPVDLTGATALAKFRRSADNMTVTQAATISGNVAYVQLHPDCYRYSGQLKAMMELTTGSGDTAVVATAKVTYFSVAEGASDQLSDPENIIPSIGQVIALMGDMEDALAACEVATEGAIEAADDAEVMAARAEDAAMALEGMTGEITMLPYGSTPVLDVEADPVDGHYNMAMQIPEGPTGTRGSLPWDGTAITGTSPVPTAYATGLASVNAGDIYRYDGADVADVGHEYRCTLGGNAATALWVYSRNSRGAPGTGSVNRVDGVAADINGDVALGAIRYNAAMPALTDADRLQARSNMAAVGTGDILNVLSSTLTDKALSAAQGKVLKDGLDAKASVAAYSAAVPASGWSASAPYTQTVTVAGILTTDAPLVDVALSTTAATAILQLEAYGYVGKVAAGASQITVTCYEDKPTVDLTLTLRVVR